MPSRQHTCRKGFILTEAVTALTLIGLVLGAATLLLVEHSRATEHVINHRRAQLAAESCLDWVRAGGIKAVDADFSDENNIRYQVRVTEAESEWKPLRRVSVAATIASSKGRVARYTIRAYVAERRSAGEGGP